MRLRLPVDQLSALQNALSRATKNEIGGQIFGEQLAPSNFRVTELTFQTRPGTFARFVVDLIQAARDAVRFFDRTEHHYLRFNYIGEWHSHPSLEVRPSETDVRSMEKLVRDPSFRGNFAILMITRLDDSQVTCAAWLFDRLGRNEVIELEREL